jgi:hypothetical protein
MPFVKGDKNINRVGRVPRDPGSKKPTNRELKEKELVMLLRKIKPHVSASIVQAARIMNNEEARDQDKLKAATIILDNYRRLALDLYDGEEVADGEGSELQPTDNTPVFSLKVVNNE